MLYRTSSRFPTATTLKVKVSKLEYSKIVPNTINEEITNETLARPFNQVKEILKIVELNGDNQR